MPEFSDVCRFFDNTPVSDAYTAVYLWDGQFSTFNETSASGQIVSRKSLSIDPTFVLPTRHALSFEGEEWLVGLGISDTFQGTIVRTGYVLKRVSDTVDMRSPANLLNNTNPFTVFTNFEYFKDIINVNVDSDFDPFWNVFFAPAEPAAKGMFLKTATKLFRIRATHYDPSGLLVGETDEIDAGAQVSVTYGSGTYDPVTETTTGGTTTVPGIFIDSNKLYYINTEADAKLLPGDKTIILVSALPVNTVIKVGIQAYRVMNVNAELDAFAHHIRRA